MIDFDSQYRQYRSLVRNLCKPLCSSVEDREDLEQAVWIKAYRRFETWDPERGSFGTWIGILVRNVASDMRRSAKRRPVCVPCDSVIEKMIEQIPDKSQEAEPQIDLSWLPEKMRLAFELVALGGKSSAEAAKTLGTTPGTIRTFVWKARALIAQRYSPSDVRSAA